MDLSPLSALLAGLGPWGLLIGAAIPLVVNLLRNRLNPAPAPAPGPAPVPGPAPTPVPAPAPAPSGRPILDALAKLLPLLLSSLLAKRAGPVESVVFGDEPEPDLEAEDVEKLLAAFKSLAK